MANTGRAALPYPVGTDKVRGGAAAIQALATATDPGVVIAQPLTPSAAFAGAYPVGISLMPVALADAQADGGWPMLASGFVQTIKAFAGSYCTQVWYRASSASTDVFVRHLLSTANSPWQRAGGVDYVSQVATALVNCGNNTWTVLTMGTAETTYGTAISGDGTGLVINTPGLYEMSARVSWNGAAAVGRRMIGFGTHNDSSGANVNWRSGMYGGDGSAYDQTYTEQVSIAAADTGRISLWAHQLSGAVVGVTNRRFVIRRIG
jgi:hypothetical protein